MRISDVQAGERLDRFLTSYLKEYSRSQIQKLIQADVVCVNDRPRNKHYELQAGDVIDIQDFAATSSTPAVLPMVKTRKQQIADADFDMRANKNVPIEVIAETKEYVVIEKSAGVVVHPANAHPQNDTLVHGLLALYPELAGIGENKYRPGIVHRIDKDVSGVMVVARTAEMYAHLKQQFQNRTVYKEYLALVHGVLSEPHGVIDFDIVRSKRDRTKMAAVPRGGGKPARTDYNCVQQFQHYAYMSLHPETGRTHQIRVHCNAIGHPIVGDPIYHPKVFHARLQPGRLFLHAHQLKFMDVQGNVVEYMSPLPLHLQAILDDLYQTV